MSKPIDSRHLTEMLARLETDLSARQHQQCLPASVPTSEAEVSSVAFTRPSENSATPLKHPVYTLPPLRQDCGSGSRRMPLELSSILLYFHDTLKQASLGMHSRQHTINNVIVMRSKHLPLAHIKEFYPALLCRCGGGWASGRWQSAASGQAAWMRRRWPRGCTPASRARQPSTPTRPRRMPLMPRSSVAASSPPQTVTLRLERCPPCLLTGSSR